MNSSRPALNGATLLYAVALNAFTVILLELAVRWYWAQDFPTALRIVQAVVLYGLSALAGAGLGVAAQRLSRRGEIGSWALWGFATVLVGFLVALRVYWNVHESMALPSLAAIGVFLLLTAGSFLMWRFFVVRLDRWLAPLTWLALASFIAWVDYDKTSVLSAAGNKPLTEVAAVSVLFGAAVFGLFRSAATGFRKWDGWAAALVALVLLTLLGAPHHRRPPLRELSTGTVAPTEGAPDNGLLIVIDTVPAKRFGCYGGMSTPAIDELARDGILFRNAYSASNWTRSSFASILTGLSPSEHRVGVLPTTKRDTALSELIDTLPERMREHYTTIGLVCNPHLSYGFGLTQGFEIHQYYNLKTNPFSLIRFVKSAFRLEKRYETADRMVRHAINKIRAASRSGRFFMMLHILDPHMPYYPHPEYLPELQDLYPDASEDLLHHLSEIKYADSQIAILFDFLKAHDLWDSTLIIVTADHGEEFGEHGGTEHGHTMYNEQIKVPLIARVPGIEPGRVIDQPISNRRIFNLFAQTLRRSGGPYDMLAGNFGEPVPVIAEWGYYGSEIKAVVDGMTKYIHCPEHQTEELYDLEADPLEQNNLILSASDALIERLFGYLQPALERDSTLTRVKGASIDEGIEAHLRALGYLGN